MGQIVKRKKTESEEELRKFSFEKNFKLVYITVAAFFTASFFAAFFGFRTLIPLYDYLQIFTFLILIAYGIQRYFFRSIFPMKNMEYLMVAVFGAGPVLMALFMILNFSIRLEERSSVHYIDKTFHEGSYLYFNAIGLPCEEYPEFCNVHEDEVSLHAGDSARITLAEGLFGYQVLEEVERIKIKE